VRRRAFLAALLVMLPVAALALEVEERTVVSREKKRTYAFYAPASVKPDGKAPLLVLIHGSTSNGKTILSRWTDMADKHGILLAAPNAIDNARWASPEDGPLLLKDVVDDVAKRYAVDGRRMYIFGHSAGAVFALQMACLESLYFAAGAIHAGAVSSDFFAIFDFAQRKIPLAIFIGTRDQFFPLDVVRATHEALKKRDFPLLYEEIPDHAHDYSKVAPDINPKIWEFFSAHPLPEDPRYTVFKDP
jgi:poly(3-hydroxybutyrate) depolymerase